MKKINNNWRRVWMTIGGISLCSVGVALFKVADFGTDPFQTFCAGLNNVIPVGFGTLYLGSCAILLIAMFLFGRRYIGLGTVLNLFIMGYMTQFVVWIIHSLWPNPSFAERVLFLSLGIPILCLASSLYFTADMGVSTYDVWALLLDEKTRLPFRLLRILTDLLCVGIGFFLHATVGAGTLITAFFMGPLIDVFNHYVAESLLKE